MKPLRLVIEGFGSFPGREEIDFAALAPRGLFVVTGPTGAGKTTIFDAMVFALYGRPPGSREVNGVRSQYVAPDKDTSVTFDFEAEGTAYRVVRNPEYSRPKVRGTGLTKQQAGAVLTLLDDTATPVASGVRPVNERCTELVGLDAEQFERVVLLPQGEFDRFLTAPEAQREELLRKLFGGAVYRLVTETLDHEAKHLESELRDQEGAISHFAGSAGTALGTARSVLDAHAPDGSGADSEPGGDAGGEGHAGGDGDGGVTADQSGSPIDLDAITALLVRERERLQVLDTRALEAKQVASEAGTVVVKARAESERFDLARTLERELADLEEMAVAREADAHRAQRSRSARPVVSAADAAARAQVRADEAGWEHQRVAAEVREVLSALGRAGATQAELPAATVAAELTAAQSRNDQDDQLLGGAAAARKKLAKTQTEVASKQAAVERCKADLQIAIEAMDAAAQRVEAARAKAGGRDAAETALTLARKREADRAGLEEMRSRTAALESEELAANRHYLETMQAYLRSEAPRLAAQLTAGEPCMVCGSTEHPAPAAAAAGSDVGHDAVADANEAWSRASSILSAHRAQIAERELALGPDAHCAIEDLAAAAASAEAGLERAVAAAEELTAAESASEQANRRRQEQQDAFDEATRQLQECTGRVMAEADEAERLAGLTEGIDPEVVAMRAEVLGKADGLAGRYERALKEADEADGALRHAQTQLEAELERSPFAGAPDARAELLDPTDEEELAAQAEAWRTQRGETRTRLEQLVELGVPEARPALEALEQAANAAEELAGRLSDAVSSARTSLEHAEHDLLEARTLTEQAGELRGRAQTARVVANTCAGRGTSFPRLERWVLAAELERVADAANVHLARLTKHRYQLRLPTNAGKAQLDLAVFDAHSGGERSTGSLSGGEKFQASLALALGLADVVSQGGNASGHIYEALFVDEGFGSLDPQALDEAIGALASLQAGGRMVGAITHVEAMKQQLHVGIEVRRLPDSGGSTLVVSP